MLNRTREWWERLGRNNQIILVASSLGVMVALIGFIAWASTPEYVPLFSNLAAQDANAITDKLKEYNVPSRLVSNGTTIEVPMQNRDEMAIKIASQGLPAQSAGATLSGDELLSKGTMTDTSEMESFRMRRAQEERLAQIIMKLDAVAGATVTLAQPDSSPLVVSNHDAKAAVMVTPRPGHQLSEDGVRGIVRILQMSVTGLADKDISVVSSTTGGVLWDGTKVGGGEMGRSELLTDEEKLSEMWRAKLQSALDSVVGPHASIVLANVELYKDSKKINEVTHEAGPATAKTTTEETLNGQGNTTRGTPGGTANINPANPAAGGGVPTYAGATTGDALSNYHRTDTTLTAAPSTRTTETQEGIGKIDKLAVSVLLDSGKIQPADQAAMKTTIQQTISTTIAASPTNNTDARLVSVNMVPFNHSEQDAATKAAAAAEGAENTRRLAATLVPFAIMVIALFLLARALRKPKYRTTADAQLALAGGGGGLSLPGSLGGLGGGSLVLGADGLPVSGQTVGSADGADAGPLGLSAGAAGPHTYDIIEEAFDADLESILHLTRSKPDMVSALIKSWISEDM